jgi:hypothetical protein
VKSTVITVAGLAMSASLGWYLGETPVDRGGWEWAGVHAGAFLFVTLGPQAALASLGHLLWEREVLSEGGDYEKARKDHRDFPPKVVGLVERSLYLTSFLVGYPAFVAVWMGVKVAGAWRQWSEGMAVEGGREPLPRIPGRVLVNLFSTSAGLSLLFAASTAQGLLLWLEGLRLMGILVLPTPFLLWFEVRRLAEADLCRLRSDETKRRQARKAARNPTGRVPEQAASRATP